jgi:hypothetical protein
VMWFIAFVVLIFFLLNILICKLKSSLKLSLMLVSQKCKSYNNPAFYNMGTWKIIHFYNQTLHSFKLNFLVP